MHSITLITEGSNIRRVTSMKFALAITALLVAAGSAFAENPNASWNNISEDRITIEASGKASAIAPESGSHPADQYDSRLNTH